jgi:hypothetical protein
LVALAVLAAMAVQGCALREAPEADPGADPGTTTRSTGPSVQAAPARPAQARARLAALRSVERHPGGAAYDRAAFGAAWADTDRNGCNQRDDVLLRDAVPGTARTGRQGRCDHDVLAGTWVDPYTGRTLTFTDLKDRAQAQAIQIDHVVPLAEAWLSGAATWSDRRREAFATDLDELLAVDGPTNAGKGDGDPAAWRPRRAFQCTYAVRWVATKARWDLAVDAAERRALEEMLQTCRAGT